MVIKMKEKKISEMSYKERRLYNNERFINRISTLSNNFYEYYAPLDKNTSKIIKHLTKAIFFLYKKRNEIMNEE